MNLLAAVLPEYLADLAAAATVAAAAWAIRKTGSRGGHPGHHVPD